MQQCAMSTLLHTSELQLQATYKSVYAVSDLQWVWVGVGRGVCGCVCVIAHCAVTVMETAKLFFVRTVELGVDKSAGSFLQLLHDVLQAEASG